MKKIYRHNSDCFDTVQISKIFGVSFGWVISSIRLGLKADISQCSGKTTRNKYRIYKKDVIDFVNAHPDMFVKGLIQESR